MTKVRYVYESLRDEIIEGDLQPGERLVFNSLAKRFGVSPIPVREAVRQLESEGLVELQPHTKVLVKGFPIEQGIWAFELRAELEPLALEQATPFVYRELLDRLEALLIDMAEWTGEGDFERFVAGYFRFHDLLFALTPNRRLVDLILDLRAVSRRFHRIYRCRDVVHGSEADLYAIHDALLSGEAKDVYDSARRHRLAALRHIQAFGQDPGSLAAPVC